MAPRPSLRKTGPGPACLARECFSSFTHRRPPGARRPSAPRTDRRHRGRRANRQSSSSSRRSGMRGCHSPGTGRITVPGSSRPQSTRNVQRKRRPTSNVASMTVLRARRGATGSNQVTLRGGLRRAIPFLLVGSRVGSACGALSSFYADKRSRVQVYCLAPPSGSLGSAHSGVSLPRPGFILGPRKARTRGRGRAACYPRCRGDGAGPLFPRAGEQSPP